MVRRLFTIQSWCGIALMLAVIFVVSSCRTLDGSRQIGFHYVIEVHKGDSLASIATKYGTSWQAIARENGLRDYRDIKEGQRLRVKPGPGGHPVGERLASTADTPAGGAGKPVARHSTFLFGAEMADGLRNEANVIDDGELVPGLGSGPEEDLTSEVLAPQMPPVLKGRSPEPSKNDENSLAFLIWPTRGDVSSYFGARGKRMHKGIDIMAPRGSNILAAADAKVIHTGFQRGYGRFAVLQHANGLRTLYAHCLKVLAKSGQQVKQGDVIALVGATGRAKGYHLHFELRDPAATPLDPIPYIKNENLVTQN